MNIFILSTNPIEAAKMQCDKHAGGKMAVESAQMLSTAHRMIDGNMTRGFSKSGKRMIKLYDHPTLNDVLYKAVHHNHPCTTWTMKTDSNYMWHYEHFIALCDEYTFRYGKIHKTDSKLRTLLSEPPKKIVCGELTQFPLAMNTNPECMFPENPVKSYRSFYQTKQNRFKMIWTKREIPEWFKLAS